MRNLLLVLFTLIVVAAGVWAVANFAFEQKKVQTDTVYGTVRAVVVKTDAGDVDVVPARRLLGVRETQHWVISRPKLVQTRKNGVLTIKSTCPTKVEADLLKCFSDVRVAVPAGMKVTVKTDSGDVDVRGPSVRSAHVESHSGDVELDLTGRQGLVYADSDSGDVDVVARSARAVDAQTNSGDVTVDVGGLPRRVVAGSDSGDVEVAVPRGSYRIKAVADSGKARVSGLQRNGRSLQSVHARTDSGDVVVHAR